MSKYRHHKYKWEKPFGNAKHQWSFVGPFGGVHFHVSENRQYGDSAGLEFHHNRACHYRADEAPDHPTCWLTGEPCWHDGTSLHATETLWPIISAMLKSGDHDAIFRVLEREADERFDDFALVNRQRLMHPENVA